MNFKSLGLSEPILRAIEEQGYKTPSPIQKKAIPAILQGQDVMAAAQTGTGKTAAFTLPILQHLATGPRPSGNQAKTLILTPTRELAAQVADNVSNYGRHLNLHSNVVYGGVKINPQMKKLRRGSDILVATPGRLLDLYQQNSIKFQRLEILVLDEADRMLDMGFIHDIKKILSLLPRKRQNLMFSATFSGNISKLAKSLMHNPIEISVNQANATATTVKQWIHPVDKKKKPALLTELIRQKGWDQALVFTKTKHGANRLTKHLDNEGITAGVIHGNKSQSARTKTLANFKAGELRILVATDIAARGLDIDQLPQVVNYDLPTAPEDYVHRIGRTGRAGSKGQAISLVSADEFKQLSNIEQKIQHVLVRELVKGFEPEHDLPASSMGTHHSKEPNASKNHHLQTPTKKKAKEKNTRSRSQSTLKTKRGGLGNSAEPPKRVRQRSNAKSRSQQVSKNSKAR